MLDLIVLGKIPGTPFQITFAWLALTSFVGLVVVERRLNHQNVLPFKKAQKASR